MGGNLPGWRIGYGPTVTTQRNEAAERLLDFLDIPTALTAEGMLNEALAAERRATVERIREAMRTFDSPPPRQWRSWVAAILDEEAAR